MFANRIFHQKLKNKRQKRKRPNTPKMTNGLIWKSLPVYNGLCNSLLIWQKSDFPGAEYLERMVHFKGKNSVNFSSASLLNKILRYMYKTFFASMTATEKKSKNENGGQFYYEKIYSNDFHSEGKQTRKSQSCFPEKVPMHLRVIPRY